MIDYGSLPSTYAMPLTDESIFSKHDILTFIECQDEDILCNNLSSRISQLEKSFEENPTELNAIAAETDNIRMSLDLKDELKLRIELLHSLYEINISLNDITSKELAVYFLTRIAPVPVGPLKNGVITQLNHLANTLPKEVEMIGILSPREDLISKATEKYTDDFTNLGDIGQDYVINQALDSKNSLETIEKNLKEIQQSLKELAKIKDAYELSVSLFNLPYTKFSSISTQKIYRVAERLLDVKHWENLAHLNRMISLAEKLISSEDRKKQEAENLIIIEGGNAAFTLNITPSKSSHIKLKY